ncbi:MAG: hypothetical protein JST61_15275, partial [Acidobacteria bacterium]|nr:hypothetical protein [Acidobacteriota bacterium]
MDLLSQAFMRRKREPIGGTSCQAFSIANKRIIFIPQSAEGSALKPGTLDEFELAPDIGIEAN